MRIVQRSPRRRLLVIAALAVVAPIVPGALAMSTAAPALGDPTGPSGVAESGPLTVVERQVAGDMVVDWLDEPPAGADGWLAEATAQDTPVDDREPADEHTTGEDGLYAAATVGTTEHHAAAVSPGQGFAVFSASVRMLPSGYTIRLVGADARIEQYRDEFAAAAQAASAATGLPIRLAAGRGGSIDPSRGEITVILGHGPCGASAVGCGGPTLSSTSLVAGRVWIYGAALTMSSADRSNLAMHELGHALGLQHFSAGWTDGRQVMHPSLAGTTTYRSGDGAGLKLLAGGYDARAGSIARTAYAAGRLRVVGHVVSGSRVRVTVGSVSQDVTAAGGRFFAAIPAPAGALRVCAESLDAAAGLSRQLGCSTVAAPGTPFGGLDAVASSFETIRVTGWAADPQTPDPVRVEIRRNGAVVATATADRDRADIAAAHRHYGARHGYDLEVPAVAGANEVCVRILGVGGGGHQDLGCRSVTHAVDPVGAYQVTGTSDLGVTVSGWALDPNTPSAVRVTVSVDGLPGVPVSFLADDDHADVARAHPAHGPAHGFSERVRLTPGDHEVCLAVTNVGLGRDRSLGCTPVRVEEAASVDGLVGAVGAVVDPAGPVVDVVAPVDALVTDVLEIAGLGSR